MQDPQQPSSRKKFLLWAATAVSSVTALKFLTGTKKKDDATKKSTVKMLTEDGKLVEIDQELVIRSARKINDKELQQWIKK